MKVTIIGSGNVAEAFAKAVAQSSNEVVQVYARNKERGQQVAAFADAEWCHEPSKLKVADLYLICVSDRAIEPVTSALPFAVGSIVAHTAGCGTMEMLPEGVNRAVIYPFQTFTAGREVDFRKIYLFIEAADEVAHARVVEFARTLTDNVAEADAALRERIHLTGVLACNFVNNLYATAAEVMTDSGLSFDVIAPLIAETAAKAIESGNPAMVQTGPAVRGDKATMDRHRALIGQNDILMDIYDKISENIWRIKETSKK